MIYANSCFVKNQTKYFMSRQLHKYSAFPLQKVGLEVILMLERKMNITAKFTLAKESVEGPSLRRINSGPQ